MRRTLKARIVDGRIEALEPIEAPDGTEVEVRYEAQVPAARPARDYRGVLRKFGAPFSTEEDWEEVKRIWEPREL